MSIYESAVRGRQDFRSAYRVERERAKGLAEALAWIDQEAPGSEPRDCPTVGFQPSHDPEEELALLREILAGDITCFPSMEAKTIEICERIAGERGELCRPPDPVCLLEYLADIIAAGLDDARIVL